MAASGSHAGNLGGEKQLEATQRGNRVAKMAGYDRFIAGTRVQPPPWVDDTWKLRVAFGVSVYTYLSVATECLSTTGTLSVASAHCKFRQISPCRMLKFPILRGQHVGQTVFHAREPVLRVPFRRCEYILGRSFPMRRVYGVVKRELPREKEQQKSPFYKSLMASRVWRTYSIVESMRFPSRGTRLCADNS